MATIDVEDLDNEQECAEEPVSSKGTGEEIGEETGEETGDGVFDTNGVEVLEPEESAEAEEVTPEEELAAAQAVAAQNYEKYLRAVADLSNYKKRVEKEKSDLQSFANEKLILDILPASDNLQRALDHVGGEGESNLESLTEGVSMTIDTLFKVFTKFGLTEVKAVGEKFNPEFHHAINHDNTTDAAPGTVVSEFQKGFILKGRLIRPAMVSVAGDE